MDFRPVPDGDVTPVRRSTETGRPVPVHGSKGWVGRGGGPEPKTETRYRRPEEISDGQERGREGLRKIPEEVVPRTEKILWMRALLLFSLVQTKQGY